MIGAINVRADDLEASVAECERRWQRWYVVARIGAFGLIGLAVAAGVVELMGSPLWTLLWTIAFFFGLVGIAGYVGMTTTNDRLKWITKTTTGRVVRRDA